MGALLPGDREESDDPRQHRPCRDVHDAKDRNQPCLRAAGRRVKDHSQRREEKKLIDLEQRDEKHRAERAQEADAGFAMQIVGDAALGEAGVDQRQHVHARANRQDVPIAHPRVEAPHDPGEAGRIDRAVKQRVGHEHRQEFEHRHLRQRLLDFPNRDAPENQDEDSDGSEIRNRLAPERCRARRRNRAARRIARVGNRPGAHASLILTAALPVSTGSPR